MAAKASVGSIPAARSRPRERRLPAPLAGYRASRRGSANLNKQLACSQRCRNKSSCPIPSLAPVVECFDNYHQRHQALRSVVQILPSAASAWRSKKRTAHSRSPAPKVVAPPSAHLLSASTGRGLMLKMSSALVGRGAMAVVRLEIKTRQSLADGRKFDQVGCYEQLDGTAYFAVDPAHRLNRAVTDIDLAERRRDGLVHLTADVRILAPADQARGNHRLLFDVPNRGNRLAWARC